MISFPIANPPPGQFYAGLVIGLTLVVASLMAFLGRKPGFGLRQFVGISILALMLGPLAGAGVATIGLLFGDVHPLDRWWLVSCITLVGTIAGAIAGVLMGITGVLQILRRRCACQHEHGGRAESPPGSRDPGEKVE